MWSNGHGRSTPPNADGSYFDEDGASTMKSSDYVWLIGNGADTTTKATNPTYDRIVITGAVLPDFTGNAGVFRFDTAYGLNETETGGGLGPLSGVCGVLDGRDDDI